VPGEVLVVKGVASQTAVEDADEPVGEGVESLVVGRAVVTLSVVKCAGAGGGSEGGVGLEEEGVAEPAVAGVAGQYDPRQSPGIAGRRPTTT
jgi:hypothetical protein